MNIVLKKPNTFGALASTLCMVHCMATPLLFIAHTCAAGGCADTPLWWRSLDYLFLVVSFIAVYRSANTSSKPAIKIGLWVSWAWLCITLLNETFALLPLPDGMIYVPAIALVVLHLYHQKYCQCQTDQCCTAQKNKL